MAIKQPDDDPAEISMSPLIDCVFLLLIFFLVSTMSKKENRDIDIDLPEATSADELMPDNNNVVIGIDKEGAVYYNGKPTTIAGLHSELREIGLTDPTRRIRLDADKETPMAQVVEVLDLLQFDQLGNVGIRTYDEYYNKPK